MLVQVYYRGYSYCRTCTKCRCSLAGGLLLHDNPWTCDCGLVWLGLWLRRWLRESLQIHTAPLDAAQHLVLTARAATCSDTRTGRRTPLLDLNPEDLGCHASALSSAVCWQPQQLLWAVLLGYIIKR